jgi:rhomboid protease GluP
VAGICGALFSLLRPKEVLSVGASGAIMGLYGVILVFLLRYRARFTRRQRLKTTRIYLPLLGLALLPSIFQADLLSHVGGFLGGTLLALFVPPRRDRMNWAADEPEPPLPSGTSPDPRTDGEG